MYKLLFLLLVFILSACGAGESASSYTIVTPGTLKPGDVVPAPTGPVVLSLTGKIGVTNVNDRLDFDLPTLERLGLIAYRVDDPDLKREAEYQGVLLKQVLDVAKIAPEAKELWADALDDYKTSIPLEVNKWPVMIATLRDGAPIPKVDKGPLEIVFPNRSYPIPAEPYNRMWVWQLTSLDVR